MSDIEFSIILPVYNAELYLKECIESVINQEFQLWELILVNDGSTDGSELIYSKYITDKRIKIYRKPNKGVSVARNFGISMATGRYILFLDADDMLDKRALTIIASDIRTGADLICYDYYVLTGNCMVPARKSTRTGDFKCKKEIDEIINFSVRQSQWYDAEWYGNMRPVWSKCFKKKIITDNNLIFQEGLKYGEDMAFVLSILMNCEYVKIISHSFYIYRDNDTSVMHNRKWTGSEQGILYFTTVKKSVKGRVKEQILRDLWLETAENDWMLISSSDMSFKDKYLIFSDLIKSDLYNWFSQGKKNGYTGKKQYIYSLCIKFNFVLLLMFLSSLRNRLHARRKVQY